MNSQIHTLIAVQQIENRVEDAVNQRVARGLRRQRRDHRRFVPERRRRHGRVSARA